MGNRKVMMIGTSENSGGGISSVIRLMKKMPVWEEYSCYWLGTQIQSSAAKKLLYAVRAALMAPFIMWRYDIVHFHMVPGITLFIQLPELLTAKLYRKKIITEVHVGNQLVPYANDRFFKWWFKQADLVLLLAKKWVDLFHESYADVKTPADVLYNACEMHEPIPFEEKKKVITLVGSIDSNKAPDILIKAWAKLKDKYPDWSIKILGRGDIPTYQKLAEELHVSDKIEFMGQVVGKQKEEIFHDASIYCMCSYVEGFPMVVLESWAHSTAVVTTPVGGLPDVIQDGDNCLIFPFGDSDNLADCLERLITNPDLRKQIGINGYQMATQKFSLEAVNEDLERIYEEVLGK